MTILVSESKNQVVKKTERFCQLGRAVIQTELHAIAALEHRLTHSFSQACEILLNCRGRIIVMGMGKSGHIGRKVASTLASTGTPAFFVHPAEASHGDMGMVTSQDVIIAFSNSGETPELLNILPVIKRLGVALIAITGKINSTLAMVSSAHLDASVEQEACPLGLAPTSSSTASLVMGDALAIALLEARGFTEQDFALFHPGGALGRRLLLRVETLMHTDKALPKVNESCLLSDALLEVTNKRLGMTTVVGENGRLYGVFTDGDLRRAIDGGHDIRSTSISEVMTRHCVTIPPQLLATAALQIMQAHKITSLVVVDPMDTEQKPVGVIHIHDLLQAGVV